MSSIRRADRKERLNQAISWACDTTGSVLREADRRSGTGGTIVLLTDETAAGTVPRFVLKLFNRAAYADPLGALDREVDALERLVNVTQHAPPTAHGLSIGAPVVVGCSHPVCGYLMHYIAGNALSTRQSVCNGKWGATDLATAITSLMQAYHGKIQEPVGDFHAGNLILAEDCLFLIDPTISTGLRDICDRAVARTDMMRADLGYWLFDFTLRALRPTTAARAETRRNRRLTLMLLENQLSSFDVCDRPEWADDIKRIVDNYYEAAVNSSRRAALARPVGTRLAAALLRRALVSAG